jgi:hypothetical protein
LDGLSLPATVTINGFLAPAPLYSVDVPVPLFATHHGLVALALNPHALTKFGSVIFAKPGTSETKLVTSNCCADTREPPQNRNSDSKQNAAIARRSGKIAPKRIVMKTLPKLERVEP